VAPHVAPHESRYGATTSQSLHKAFRTVNEWKLWHCWRSPDRRVSPSAILRVPCRLPCVTLRHPVSALNAIALITLVNPVNGEDNPDRTVTMPYAMWYVWCSMYCGMGYGLPLWVQTDCQVAHASSPSCPSNRAQKLKRLYADLVVGFWVALCDSRRGVAAVAARVANSSLCLCSERLLCSGGSTGAVLCGGYLALRERWGGGALRGGGGVGSRRLASRPRRRRWRRPRERGRRTTIAASAAYASSGAFGK
jgi:hypothetical protein